MALIIFLGLFPVRSGVLAQGGAVPADRLIVADSGAALVQVNLETGEAALLSSGGYLDRPFSLLVESHDSVVVGDTGSIALVRVDTLTGRQELIASGPELGCPFGLAMDRKGDFLVANGTSVVRVDRVSGAVSVVAEGGILQMPLGVAVAENGELIVADAAGQVLAINEGKRRIRFVTAGGAFRVPCAIVIAGGSSCYVTDLSERSVVEVNLQTGRQTVVLSACGLITPVSIMLLDGNIVIGDPDCAELNGGVVWFDRHTNEQIALYLGGGDLVNPRGVALLKGTMASSRSGLNGGGR